MGKKTTNDLEEFEEMEEEEVEETPNSKPTEQKEDVKKEEKKLTVKDLDNFQLIIKDYLDEMLKKDENFKKVYSGNLQDVVNACNYVLSEAYKRNKKSLAMQDDEVYGLAVHFLQEKLKPVTEKHNAKVMHTKETLTEEEKSAIEKQAEEDVKKEQEAKLQSKNDNIERLKKVAYESAKEKALKKYENEKKKKEEAGQLSLF